MTAAPAAPLPDGWRRIYFFAIDRNGAKVHAGTRVRVLSLSSQRLDALSAAERHQALAMVGEVFDAENTDPYTAHARIRKSWLAEDGFTRNEIALDLAAHEMEVMADELRY